jgi:Arc/MetJ-type ribon-helix-helix transcriptional regulator
MPPEILKWEHVYMASPSEVIKKALQKDVEERTWQLLNEKVERAAPIISRVGKENWVKAVRESREER